MTLPRPLPVSDDVYARLERCLGPGRLVLDRAERDAWLPIHRAAPEPAHLARLAEPPPDVAARELVHRVRGELVSLFAARGAASNQIGRTYRYRENLEPGTARLLDALKRAVDPDARLNPGALGLHAEHDGP
jgi:FAD/FMN-containing dehydrogenase